jgi:hypothetical protein
MKIFILTATFILGLATFVPAQKTDSVTLKPGQQKKAGHNEITLKFVSVMEDSRCPEKAACVWAGNAKIQVLVADRHGKRTLTMNTNMGNKGDQYGGWAINLISLTPKADGKMPQSAYRAVFSVERLTR